MGEEKDVEELSFKQTLLDYCDNTGVYTLRQLVEPTRFRIRRLYWLALFIAGFTIFLIQTYNSSMQYLAHDSVASVNINYNESIRFPAVTICNQNAFRSTKVAELGLYKAVSSFYTNDELKLESSAEKKLANMTLAELYTKTAHRLSDFLVSCTWDEEDCMEDDFITELTDAGTCYTFNKARPGVLPKFSHTTGAKHALRLQVNIEQYEYMAGPNTGAGLRILLHDQEKAIPVYDTSQAIPPGVHARVASEILEVENLNPPYGKCEDDIELKYYNEYTKFSCSVDCLEQGLAETCGCKHFYMPSDRNNQTFPPTCTFYQESNCALQMAELSDICSRRQRMPEKIHTPGRCKCPISCSYTNVNSYISYGSTSNFIMGKTLSGDISALQKTYINAREVSQRVTDYIVATDERQVSALESIVGRIDDIFEQIGRSLNRTVLKLGHVLEDIDARAAFHLGTAIEKVRYTTKYNFVRQWQVYSERVFNHVTTEFYAMADSMKYVIRDIANGTNTTDSASIMQRNIRWMPIQTALYFKLDLIERAYNLLQKVNNSYATAESLGSYRVTTDRIYDLDFPALELFTPMSSQQELIVSNLFSHLNSMQTNLHTFISIAKTCVSSMICNEELLAKEVSNYEYMCGRYNYRIFLMNDRIIPNPLVLINTKIDGEVTLGDQMESNYQDLKETLTKITQLTNTAKLGFWSDVKTLTRKSRAYLDDPSLLKTDLAMFAGQEQITTSILNTTNLLDNLYYRGQEFSDTLQYVRKSAVAFYTSMAQETTTRPFYNRLNKEIWEIIGNHSLSSYYIPIFETLLQRPINVSDYYDLFEILNADFIYFNDTIFQANMTNIFLPLQQLGDIQSILDSSADDFQKAVSELRWNLASFLEGNKIGISFFKENFLMVDVFLSELSFTQIKQQIAYGFSNLMGDIGGSAGLFIGASLITLFEIMDLLCSGACLIKNKLGGTARNQARGQDNWAYDKEPNLYKEPDFKHDVYANGYNKPFPMTTALSTKL